MIRIHKKLEDALAEFDKARLAEEVREAEELRRRSVRRSGAPRQASRSAFP